MQYISLSCRVSPRATRYSIQDSAKLVLESLEYLGTTSLLQFMFHGMHRSSISWSLLGHHALRAYSSPRGDSQG